MGSYRVCCCFTRKFKVTEADPPSDVKVAFNKYSDGVRMTVDQLRKFIEECQTQDGNGGSITVMEVEKIVEQVLPLITLKNRKSFTLEDFHRYLFSSELNPPIRSKVHHDMDAPLTHYFIYTGHNSYLTGNQLSSVCSEEPIIIALKRGVRVIELDLWPNSSRDNVHVLHGRTPTAPVDLLRCFKAIKDNAFTASPFPVIITLEDHLTSDLQAKVAQMLFATFGEMLYLPKGRTNELPTPDELQHKILISIKPSEEYLGAEVEKCIKSQRVKDPNNDDGWGAEPSRAVSYKDKNDEYESDESDYNIEELEDSDSSPAHKSWIAMHAVKPIGGLEVALKVDKDRVKLLSLSEQAMERAVECHQEEIVRFTQKNILRIYPDGTRFTFPNYKPLFGWLHGAQMVAFNMQGYGRSLWLMHGMFMANGGCGYVKKPDFLHRDGPNNEVFNSKQKLPVKTILKVKIYMGDGWHLDFKRTDFDTYSPPDFYARVGISGAPADEIIRKTKPNMDNWTPVWNEEFTFPLTLPEIALLRIDVREYDMSEKDDFAGQTCLPVSELRRGIRTVPLRNRKGDPYNAARLLMRFEFEYSKLISLCL